MTVNPSYSFIGADIKAIMNIKIPLRGQHMHFNWTILLTFKITMIGVIIKPYFTTEWKKRLSHAFLPAESRYF